MMFDDKCRMALKEVVLSDIQCEPQLIRSLVDLTHLQENATPETIQELALKAMEYGMAAVCVFPKNLDDIPTHFSLKRATVVNFPTGNEHLTSILNTIDRIQLNQSADEIDYVFPYQAYLNGHHDMALSHCEAVYQHCRQHQLLFKVILEVGAFPSIESIYQLSQQVIGNGCDFLKTSTGKIEKGATLEAVYAMLLAIKNSQTPCGIKCSGGIKTMDQAFNYVQLAQFMLNQTPHPSWIRIGTSALFV